jgi:hypothetical protein
MLYVYTSIWTMASLRLGKGAAATEFQELGKSAGGVAISLLVKVVGGNSAWR